MCVSVEVGNVQYYKSLIKFRIVAVNARRAQVHISRDLSTPQKTTSIGQEWRAAASWQYKQGKGQEAAYEGKRERRQRRRHIVRGASVEVSFGTNGARSPSSCAVRGCEATNAA